MVRTAVQCAGPIETMRTGAAALPLDRLTDDQPRAMPHRKSTFISLASVWCRHMHTRLANPRVDARRDRAGAGRVPHRGRADDAALVCRYCFPRRGVAM